MKRHLFIPLLLLFTGLMLSSCEKENLSTDGTDFSEAQLRAGTWTVDQVAINQFDSQGFLVSTDIVPFGENKQGGICTFSFGEDNVFTMVDNGNVFTFKYQKEGRVLTMDNGDNWGIREMSDDRLEVTLQGEQVNNPCDFSVSGAVYYLSRNNR